MLEVLMSWIIIAAAAYLFGKVCISFAYRRVSQLQQLDVYVITGLLFINVFAEVWSLFYKVGVMFDFILAMMGTICVFVLFIAYRRKKNENKNENENKNTAAVTLWQNYFTRNNLVKLFMAAFIIGASAAWASDAPMHYDDGLYHAQAVEWIEDYGIIPGLGNLHNRMAYNSAFMVLQAVFSFKWYLGRSLHSLNGFIVCVFLLYAVLTNSLWKGQRLKVSDALKLVMIYYICTNTGYISSLSSDLLAMLLLAYVFTRWAELIEQGDGNSDCYAWLCMAGVWGGTVKLSVVILLLLSIYPVVKLLQAKKGRKVLAYVGAALLIGIPWVLRNIVISGYLIYPMSQLDLLNVDWKMPASVADYDRMEIAVWGRGTANVADYGAPVWEWMSTWFLEKNLFNKTIIMMGVLGSIWLIWRGVKLLKNREYDKAILHVTAIAGLIFWVFSAPLMRYGVLYCLIPVCIMIPQWTGCKQTVFWSVAALYAIPLFLDYFHNLAHPVDVSLVQEMDYTLYECESVDFEGYTIWIPKDGDQAGYYAFPSTPYAMMLEKIELRGDDLKDGFRIKSEYQDVVLINNGVIQ